MAGQTITVSVLADTKKFSSAMSKLGEETGLSKLGNRFKTLGKAVAVGVAAAGAGAVAIGKNAVDAASALEQSMGGVDSIFKETAGQVHAFAKSAATDLGLSKNAYNELAGIIGTTLKNSGTPLDALAGKTNDLIGVSADLAATFGGPVTEASNAMASALRGEFEPLRRYGVSLSQADINARALADSGKASAKELTKQEKALATQALILEQSADASGAFARESNTLAGQQERLKAKLQNLSATIGGYLLPIMTKVTGWLSDRLEPAFQSVTRWVQSKVVPAFKTLGRWLSDNQDEIKALASRVKGVLVGALKAAGAVLKTLAGALKTAGEWVVKNTDWLLPLVAGIGAMVLAYQSYLKVMAIWKAAVAVWTAAQAALNLVMAANPIGLVVLAVVGLVTAIGLLWAKNEGFRNAVTGIWDGIKNVFSATVDAISGFLSGLWDFIKEVFGWTPLGMVVKNWDKITAFFDRAMAAIGGFFTKAWDVVKKVWSYTPLGLIVRNWDKIMRFFGEVPGKVKGFFSNAVAWLKSAGTWIISGLRNGITERWNAVASWFLERGAAIKAFFSAALTWLTSSGSRVISGLRSGLVERWTAVVSWFKTRPDAIKRTVAGAGGWLIDAGKNVVSGFISGIKSMSGALIAAIKSAITDKLPGFVKTALQIRSPSKVMAKLARWVPLGVAKGITDQAGAVDKAMSSLTGRVTDVEFNATARLSTGSTTPRRLEAAGSSASQASSPNATGASPDLEDRIVAALASITLNVVNQFGVREAARIVSAGIGEVARNDPGQLRGAMTKAGV